MSVPWILNRQYTSTQTRLDDNPFLNTFINGFNCSTQDEYHIEGEMGMPLPPFVAKFSESLLNGNLLCIADEDGHVKLVDTRKTKETSLIKEWSAHSNAVFDLAWIANEPKLVTASGDQTARLWDIEKAETIANFRGHTCSLKSVAVQPDSNRVFITGARDGNIMAWDTRCNRKNGFLNPTNTISHAHAMPVKETVTLSGKKTKRRSRRTSMYNADAKASVTSAIFQGTHTVISSGACDGILKFWDLRKNYTNHKGDAVAFHVIPFPGKSPRTHGYSSLAVDSTMSRLFATCTNDSIYEYLTCNLATKPTAQYQGHLISSFYVKTALSPDNRFLLCGSSDGQAYIWRTDKPTSQPWMLRGHFGEVTSVTWSPNGGDKIVTCSDDNTFKVWRMFQNLDDKETAGRCERRTTVPVKIDGTTPDTEQDNGEVMLPALERKRTLPPLNLCTDRKLTVTWKLHDVVTPLLQRQQSFSPVVCKTPDSIDLSDSPKPCTSLTPNRPDVTPLSDKNEESITPASSTTPTSLTTASSRITGGRTPRSSRLFMESWLKSPGSPESDTQQGRRMSTRRQNNSYKYNEDNTEGKTKLSIIKETNEPAENLSEIPKPNSPRFCKSCSTDKKESPNDDIRKSPPLNNTTKKTKETPQRTRRSTRNKRKSFTQKSESIKKFLIQSKRKRGEHEEERDNGTCPAAKCLKMTNCDNNGKANSSSCDTMQKV